MDESTFHRLADTALNEILAKLEAADESGALEVEYEGGVLTIILLDGKQYILINTPRHGNCGYPRPSPAGCIFLMIKHGCCPTAAP